MYYYSCLTDKIVDIRVCQRKQQVSDEARKGIQVSQLLVRLFLMEPSLKD